MHIRTNVMWAIEVQNLRGRKHYFFEYWSSEKENLIQEGFWCVNLESEVQFKIKGCVMTKTFFDRLLSTMASWKIRQSVMYILKDALCPTDALYTI